MKSLRVTGTATIKTATVFEMVDSSFNGTADLVGLLPLISITDRTGIHAKITIRIDVDHASGSGRSTGILAVTGAMVFSVFTFVPGHLWTDELECRDAAPQVRSIAFRLHGKLRIMRATGDAGVIDRVICRRGFRS